MFNQIYTQVMDNGISFDLSSEIIVNSWLVSDSIVLKYEAFTNFNYLADKQCLPIIFCDQFRDEKLRWLPYYEKTTGLTHLRQINDENQLIYAAFNVISPSNMTTLVNLYNKKNIKIWLNDDLVYCNKNNIKCLDDSLVLRLNKGNNFIFIEKNALSISFKIQEFKKEYKIRTQYLSDQVLFRYEKGISIITDSYVYENGIMFIMALPTNPTTIIDKRIQIDFIASQGGIINQINANLCEMVKVNFEPFVRGNIKIRINTMDGKAHGDTEVYLGDVNSELTILKSALDKINCETRIKNDLFAQINEAYDIYNCPETTAYEKRMMFEEEIKTLLAHLNFLNRALASLKEEKYDHDKRRGIVINSYSSLLDDNPQHYYAYIPPHYDGTKTYPVLVMLKYLYKKIQIPGFAYTKDTELPEFITISPTGRGMNRYEVAGEIELLEAIEDLASRYKINRNRIYLMGFSMGGGACWNLAQKYPTLFCGIVTLSSNLNKDYNCNLTNTNILNITGELDQMVNVIDNHSDICQFSRTYNLQNVKSLILKGTNHFALYNIYNDIKIFEWISKYTLQNISSTIYFKTDSLRYNRSHWISINDMFKSSIDCEIKAELVDKTVHIKSKNIREFEIDGVSLKHKQIKYLNVNGEQLEIGNIASPTQVVRFKTPDYPVVVKESSRTPYSNIRGLGISEIYYGKSCIINCLQKDESCSKFSKKIVSSFSRPIYYVDYREKYCEIPVYNSSTFPTSAIMNNFIIVGGAEDDFMKNICTHEVTKRILSSIYAEIHKNEIYGMIIKIPNIYAPHKRSLLISIVNNGGIAKYKNEDIFKAKFNPPLIGKHDLMRYDAVFFTEANIRKINFNLNWEIDEIFT